MFLDTHVMAHLLLWLLTQGHHGPKEPNCSLQQNLRLRLKVGNKLRQSWMGSLLRPALTH
jgi:hypothetical protein